LYQVARAQIRPGLQKQSVRVEERLDGTWAVRWPGRVLAVQVCETAARSTPLSRPRANGTAGRKRGKTGGNPGWMKGFHLHGGPWLEEVVAQAYGEPGKRKAHEWPPAHRARAGTRVSASQRGSGAREKAPLGFAQRV